MLDDVLDKSLPSTAQDISFVSAEELTDGQLVSSVLDGEDRAFNELFERYRRPVARTVGRFFRNRSDIEEFVQQSFTKAYFSLNKFHCAEDRSFAAWITRIAVNVCYDEFRRRKRTGDIGPAESSDVEKNYFENALDGRAVSAEDAFTSARLAEKVLSSLSPEDRIAITLVYSEEYTLDEAADTIGISTSTLKSRLFRCRGQLKARFGYLFR